MAGAEQPGSGPEQADRMFTVNAAGETTAVAEAGEVAEAVELTPDMAEQLQADTPDASAEESTEQRAFDAKYAKYDARVSNYIFDEPNTGKELELFRKEDQAGGQAGESAPGATEQPTEKGGEGGAGQELVDVPPVMPSTELVHVPRVEKEVVESPKDTETGVVKVEQTEPTTEVVPLADVDPTGKELAVPDAHGKEVAIPEPEHSKELAVPEKAEEEEVPQKDDVIRVAVAGTTEKAERQSVLMSAEKAYDAEMAAPGNVVRKFVRKIIKGDIGRELIQLLGRRKAEQEIAETHRLYGMDEAQWQETVKGNLQRVIDDAEVGEMMDTKAGEFSKKLEAGEGKEIRGVIDSLVTKYVTDYEKYKGDQNAKDSLQQEARRQIAELAKSNPDIAKLLGESEAYMIDVVNIAEAVRQRIDHENGIKDVLGKVEIITARLDPGARTVMKETLNTKAFDALAKVGGLNGTAGIILGSAAAIAWGVARTGGQSAFRNLTKIGIPWTPFGVSLGAGVIGRLQEKSRLAHERAQIQREEESGYQGAEGTKRRQELLNTLNNMQNATVLTEALRTYRGSGTSEKPEAGAEYVIDSKEKFDALLRTAVDASARRDLSSSDERAYLAFSGETEAQNAPERRALFLETVHARSALRKYYEGQGHKDFDAVYEQLKAGAEEALRKEAEAKDVEYKDYSTRKAIQKGLTTMAVGGFLAFGAHEVSGFVSDKVQNVFEWAINANPNAPYSTVLAGAAKLIDQNLVHPNRVNVGAPTYGPDKSLPGGGVLKLDDRLSFDPANHTLKGPNGLDISGINQNADGTFDQASIDKLHAAGVEYTPQTGSINVPGKAQSTLAEFAQKHGTKVHRKWWDNNTKAYDKNELRMDIQKIKGSDGKTIFRVLMNRMKPGDSYHDDKSSNMADNGMLQISLSRETQGMPTEIAFNKDGYVDFSETSNAEYYQMFTENASTDSEMFRGGYLEAAEQVGVGKDGIPEMASRATIVGTNSAKFMEVPTSGSKSVEGMSIFLKESAAPENGTIDIDTWFVPVPYRSGLRENGPKPERGARTEKTPPPTEGPSETEAKPPSKELEPVKAAASEGGTEVKVAGNELELSSRRPEQGGGTGIVVPEQAVDQGGDMPKAETKPANAEVPDNVVDMNERRREKDRDRLQQKLNESDVLPNLGAIESDPAMREINEQIVGATKDIGEAKKVLQLKRSQGKPITKAEVARLNSLMERRKQLRLKLDLTRQRIISERHDEAVREAARKKAQQAQAGEGEAQAA